MRIRTKLTLLLLVACAAIVTGSGVFSTISLDNYFHDRLLRELETQLRQAEFVIRRLGETDSSAYEYLRAYAASADIRLTLIDAQGVVIFESELPREKLAGVENHLQRPEVQEALRGTTGTSSRHSVTINIDMLYLAMNVTAPFPAATGFASAAIVRAGVPMTSVEKTMTDIRTNVIIAGLLVFAVAAVVVVAVSRRVARPISEMAGIAEEIRDGNLDRRIPVRSRDELGRLAGSLNGMVDRLNEDIARLSKLERVRSEFLGNVSHELRTPIFAMQGMLETLAQGALDDREVSRDFVDRALANTRRLNTLLGDLIEISRIESGEMKMSFRYFDLVEFLRATIAELLPAARQKNIELAFACAREELQGFGDRERLKQVIVNLVDNAIKYTAPGGRVDVACREEERGARIIVRDTGVGIAAEHLPRIFERFYRVDRERSREAGGTGLGLAIVKHIVEAHGSSVEIESEPGKGSTFSFLLRR